VAQGQVQPLWFGLDVARDVKPGQYEGSLRIGAKNAPQQHVDLVLTLFNQVTQDRGDSEPWRHGRLRWLNSTIGIDNKVTDPYTRLEVDGRTVRCLGRSVRFAETGPPIRFRCFPAKVGCSWSTSNHTRRPSMFPASIGHWKEGE